MAVAKERKLTVEDRTAVYIHRPLVKAAKELAAREGCTISELFEKILRSRVTKRYEKTFGHPMK